MNCNHGWSSLAQNEYYLPCVSVVFSTDSAHLKRFQSYFGGVQISFCTALNIKYPNYSYPSKWLA